MNLKTSPPGKIGALYFVSLLCLGNLKMGISYSHILTSTYICLNKYFTMKGI